MPLDVGTTLSGRYDLLALLGEGGSARVFRAHDQVVDREVAVKLMHAHSADSDRARFLREARTLARMAHPGVISVLDLGQEQGSGTPFFTMPLMTGGPITALGPLEDAPAPLARFLTAAAFAFRALHYVHAQGVTHRDLTPGNVLLDGAGVPRIMDFGLVALTEFTRHLTRSGVTLGTPAYMAPEQARGAGVGPLSDLYALGAVLYRVACGVPPFIGDSDQSVLYQHVYERVPDPRDVNPAVPDAVARVLLALLSKQPEHRPESGAAAAHLWALARRDLWACHARGQYRGGRTRTGEQADGPARVTHLREAWSVPLPGEVTWPAAVMGENDLICVGTRGGQLVLTHASGRPFATYAARDEVTAPATFHNSHVYFGAWDGTLRRVDLNTGAVHWTYQARAELTGAPTLWAGRVLAASRDGHLHALDARTGALQWAYRAGGPVAASPIIWANAALICDESGWLHALDARTGTPLWKAEVGTVHGTPALLPTDMGEATLVVATWEGEVHALGLTVEGGRVQLKGAEPTRWTYDLEDEVWASPALTPHAGGLAILAGWGGTVRALRLADGEDVWTHRLQGRVTASPVISAGLVFLASEDGELVALDAHTGAPRWVRTERQGVQATPLAADGTLYVAFMNGTLRAYRNMPPDAQTDISPLP
ncbi:serine/threonine-protein kinase [Deinococcus enclensis]|uniref:Outer membrane protein assembly factor BamB/tRNA A-37 threonylcarbamoyl transferase component Bud32 n=1 Tax=Deinococcus enclensis TaxID=1049582 RepID=A0ABT9M9Q1_9DEIO|nr:serine/threonine-protein kinase [Deinococcus enclensis]MDP9763308.1 outer membrane protein assembly factor BamB/tRNA A-37 threonylcarbamoyl transferase component Bud32 [Deinococcus enclensis]